MHRSQVGEREDIQSHSPPAGLANSEPLLFRGYLVKHPSQALHTVVGILRVSAGPQSLLRAPGASGADGVPSHWSCVVVSLAVACTARLGT